MNRPVDVLADWQSGRASRVTVAISLYNYRDYIDTCLTSVANQTLDALSVLVVDDASKDEGGRAAAEWLERHGERFARARVLRHVKNGGLAAARNTAFGAADTDYVFVLDADNQIYPRCLAQLSDALDRTDASFAYCYLEQFGDAQGLINLRPWNPSSLQHGNWIDAMVLLRRQVWASVGGYTTTMPVMGWEDFDLWFKIARSGGFGIQIPEILARYCVHGDSMIRTVTNPRVDELWRFLRACYPEAFRIEEFR